MKEIRDWYRADKIFKVMGWVMIGREEALQLARAYAQGLIINVEPVQALCPHEKPVMSRPTNKKVQDVFKAFVILGAGFWQEVEEVIKASADSKLRPDENAQHNLRPLGSCLSRRDRFLSLSA